MNYDYEFLYAMKSHLINLRSVAKSGKKIVAHSVLDEILLVLVADESEFLIENNSKIEVEPGWKEWAYDILGDADVDMYLYSNTYLAPNNGYHFSHWLDEQFY